MSAKRSNISLEEVVMTKKLKLNDSLDLPEDMVLSQDKLSAEIDTILNYDFVMNEFSVGIKKQMKEKEARITLSEIECEGTLRLLPYAFKVAAKYSSNKASKPVDISLEPVEFNAGDVGTVLSIKESQFKRGDIQFDLRKCMKKENGSLVYTKEGIRVDADAMLLIQGKLKSFKNKIAETVSNTRKLVMTAQASLLIQEIDGLNSSGEKSPCYGCETNHPSQIQHMGLGGCLSQDTPETSQSWEDAVNKHWTVVSSRISVEDAFKLAETTLTLLPELKGMVCSKVEKMTLPSEDELKEMVLNRDELLSDRMYISCEKMMMDK